MEVPLSRFLTRFSAEEDVAAADTLALDSLPEPEPEPEPEPGPSEAELQAQLAEARFAQMLREIEAKYIQEVESIRAAHDMVTTDAVDTARARWCEEEGKTLSHRLDAMVPDLRSYLAEKIADVLTPLVAQAVIERTREALLESLDLLLADRAHPILTIRGPGDLLDAIRAAHPNAVGIDLIPHDDLDAIISGDGLRIETRLEAALTALTQEET